MDRIRKALDLARQERDGSLDLLMGGPRPFDLKAGPRLPAVIEYTATRTFSPASAHLEANRVMRPAAPDDTAPNPAAAAFRMLRTQVLQRMDENGWRSLAIVSPSSNDGKTTTAINLAANIANDQRHTVLLVDFDLKHPTIASKFGLSPDAGTDDVLRGEARIEDCLVHPEGFERLVLLPARGAMAASSETLAGLRCRDLLSDLRGRYPERILVFDLPPLLGADDALAFAPLIDCALMVIAEGATRREDLLRSMELLRKTPVIGTVLNRATSSASLYG
jgi:protein-tyrosine kinase